MRQNRLRQVPDEGKPTFAPPPVQSAWPTSTELVGRSGQFDYVELLAEYEPYSLHDLGNIGRAIELNPTFYCAALGVKDFNLSSGIVVPSAFYAQQGRALRERVAAISPA